MAGRKHAPHTLRRALSTQLNIWLGDKPELIDKELALFDTIVSRRDFLKSASYAAIAATLMHGCNSSSDQKDYSGPPSSWLDDEDSYLGLSPQEQAAVETPSRISADADLFDVLQGYNPLPAIASSDALDVDSSAVLESFNPHIVAINSQESLDDSGMATILRNYGTPEFIHLRRASSNSDYFFSVYEKGSSFARGLQEQNIPLSNTASQEFNNLIATNGTFHNRVHNAKAYSQKMLMAANIGPDFDLANTALSPLVLYYESMNHPLLSPGVELDVAPQWRSLDLLAQFRSDTSEFDFQKFTIKEVQSYHDGAHHSFIYGTLNVDDFYNYGFVVTFNAITDEAPTLKFFAPHFLSARYGAFKSFVERLKSSSLRFDARVEDMVIFGSQYFRPIAQFSDSSQNPLSAIPFGFFSFSISAQSGASTLYPDSTYMFSLEDFTRLDSNRPLFALNLCSIDTSLSEGVIYPFSQYNPTIVFNEDEEYMEYAQIIFDTTQLPLFDLWQSLYERTYTQYGSSFTRFSEGGRIIMAMPFYDTHSLGVVHKSFSIAPNGDGYRLTEAPFASYSLMDDALLEDKSYKEIWFDELKGYLGNHNTLHECINNYSGIVDFHCAHNPQGLLRSSFVIRASNNAGGVNSLLISFDEQGIQEQLYATQGAQTLYEQMRNNQIFCDPPLPVAFDVRSTYRWFAISQESEAIYAALRPQIRDSATQSLKPNDASQGELFSYFHATCEGVEGVWSRQQLELDIPSEQIEQKHYTQTFHQVRLHVSNIYDQAVALQESTYVEVRFAKPVLLKEYTNSQEPKSFHLNRQTSLFLKTNDAGEIVFEVHTGESATEKYEGTLMMYRFVDSSALRSENNRPVALLASVNGTTTEYKQMHLSFNAFDRLSGSEHSGAVQSLDIDATLKEEIENPDNEATQQIKSAYTKLKESSAPDNNTPLRNLRHTYKNRISRRGVRSVTLRSGAVSDIDPLTHIAVLGGVKIRFKLWRKVKKAARAVAHVATTAVVVVADAATAAAKAAAAAAAAAAEAAKRAVSEMAMQISSIASNIVSSIVDAISDIANAIVAIAKKVVEFAKWVWNFIKMLFDMERCFKIGQEIKQIYIDQMSKDSDIPNNAYSKIKNMTAVMQQEIRKTVETTKQGINSTIDGVFGSSSALDADIKSSLQVNRMSSANATKSNYLFDQSNRASFDSSSTPAIDDASAAFLCDSQGSIESLIGCILEQLANRGIDALSDQANRVVNLALKLFSGASLGEIRDELAGILKSGAHHLLETISIIVQGIAQIPLAILNGSDAMKAVGSLFDKLMRPLLKLIGLLLFRDADKFKGFEDFVYFMLGFFMNAVGVIGGVFFGDGHKSNLDYIHSGELRRDINAGLLYSNARNQAYSKGIKALKYTVDAVGYLQTFVQFILGIKGVWNLYDVTKTPPTAKKFMNAVRLLYLPRAAGQFIIFLSDTKISTPFAIGSFLTSTEFLLKSIRPYNHSALGYLHPIFLCNSISAILGLTHAAMQGNDTPDKRALIASYTVKVVESLARMTADNTEFFKDASPEALAFHTKASRVTLLLNVVGSVTPYVPQIYNKSTK